MCKSTLSDPLSSLDLLDDTIVAVAKAVSFTALVASQFPSQFYHRLIAKENRRESVGVSPLLFSFWYKSRTVHRWWCRLLLLTASCSNIWTNFYQPKIQQWNHHYWHCKLPSFHILPGMHSHRTMLTWQRIVHIVTMLVIDDTKRRYTLQRRSHRYCHLRHQPHLQNWLSCYRWFDSVIHFFMKRMRYRGVCPYLTLNFGDVVYQHKRRKRRVNHFGISYPLLFRSSMNSNLTGFDRALK